jgi:hypothetical protein
LAHSDHATAESVRSEKGHVRAKVYPGLTDPAEDAVVVEILTYDRGPQMLYVPRSEVRS